MDSRGKRLRGIYRHTPLSPLNLEANITRLTHKPAYSVRDFRQVQAGNVKTCYIINCKINIVLTLRNNATVIYTNANALR
jgi:hypothetical protein